MAPYIKLSEAEAEAQTAKAEMEKAQAEKELAEQKAAEEAEKQRLQKEAEEKREAEEKKGYNTGITYDNLARTPDDYEDKKVRFSGTVIQVIEGSTSTEIRLAVGGNYNKILYGYYSSSIVKSRLLEDDYVTIYGVSDGLLTYQSTMGGNITIPAVYIDKIDQ